MYTKRKPTGHFRLFNYSRKDCMVSQKQIHSEFYQNSILYFILNSCTKLDYSQYLTMSTVHTQCTHYNYLAKRKQRETSNEKTAAVPLL